MRVKWSDLSREDFDTVVSLLLHRLHPEGRFQTIDGAGGDGGRDAVLLDDEAGYRRIFQWKSHTGRIDSSRRRKIKASLHAALEHDPAEWILIVPTDLSGAELAWFEALRAQHQERLQLIYRVRCPVVHGPRPDRV